MKIESEEVRPALTAEEWAEVVVERDGGMFFVCARSKDGVLSVGDDWDSTDIRPENRHAVAAYALYYQPFGFTHEMVDALRSGFDLSDDAYRTERDALASAAIDRIEALLPPRGILPPRKKE